LHHHDGDDGDGSCPPYGFCADHPWGDEEYFCDYCFSQANLQAAPAQQLHAEKSHSTPADFYESQEEHA
jgi:hypothetical protein